MKFQDKIKYAVETNDIAWLFKLTTKESDEINLPINDKDDSLLLWSIENNNWYLIEHLLKNRHVDINAVNKEGNFALNAMMKQILENQEISDKDKDRYVSAVKHLAGRRDINVNLKNIDDLTPWTMAINERSYKGDTFVKYGEKLKNIFMDRSDLDDKDKTNAAHLANYLKKEVGFDKLMENKSLDVNVQDKYGKTPLMNEISKVNAQNALKLLENKDIDVDLKDIASNTALIDLLYSEGLKDKEINEIGREILSKCDKDLNYKSVSGKNPLHGAYKLKDKTLFNIISSYEDIDFNMVGENGETLLMLAVKNADLQLVNKLLSVKDIDVNAFDEKGETALMKAIEMASVHGGDSMSILNRLLNYSFTDINAYRIDAAKAALTVAIQCGNEEVVDKVLKVPGIDLNISNTYANIDAALRTDNYSVLRKLIKNPGFSVTDEDYLGMQALGHIFDISLGLGKKDLAEGALPPVLDECSREEIGILLNDVDLLGNTPVMNAVRRGADAEVVKEFLTEIVKRFGYVELDLGIKNQRNEDVFDLIKNQEHEKRDLKILKVFKDYKDGCLYSKSFETKLETEEVEEKIENKAEDIEIE